MNEDGYCDYCVYREWQSAGFDSYEVCENEKSENYKSHCSLIYSCIDIVIEED